MNIGSWTEQEDSTVCACVQKGIIRWSLIAKKLGGHRSGKQVRERWFNHLDPTLLRTSWSSDEDNTLENMHAEYGNRWSKIAAELPGRSENAVRNRWNSAEFKKRNHRPCADIHAHSETGSGTESGYASSVYSESVLSTSPAVLLLPPTASTGDMQSAGVNSKGSSSAGGGAALAINTTAECKDAAAADEATDGLANDIQRHSGQCLKDNESPGGSGLTASHPLCDPDAPRHHTGGNRSNGCSGGGDDKSKWGDNVTFNGKLKPGSRAVLFSAEDMLMIRTANDFLSAHIYSPHRQGGDRVRGGQHMTTSPNEEHGRGSGTESKNPDTVVQVSPLLAALLSPAKKTPKAPAASRDAGPSSARECSSHPFHASPEAGRWNLKEETESSVPDCFKSPCSMPSRHGTLSCLTQSTDTSVMRNRSFVIQGDAMTRAPDIPRVHSGDSWSDILMVSDEEFNMDDSEFMVSPFMPANSVPLHSNERERGQLLERDTLGSGTYVTPKDISAVQTGANATRNTDALSLGSLSLSVEGCASTSSSGPLIAPNPSPSRAAALRTSDASVEAARLDGVTALGKGKGESHAETAFLSAQELVEWEEAYWARLVEEEGFLSLYGERTPDGSNSSAPLCGRQVVDLPRQSACPRPRLERQISFPLVQYQEAQQEGQQPLNSMSHQLRQTHDRTDGSDAMVDDEVKCCPPAALTRNAYICSLLQGDAQARNNLEAAVVEVKESSSQLEPSAPPLSSAASAAGEGHWEKSEVISDTEGNSMPRCSLSFDTGDTSNDVPTGDDMYEGSGDGNGDVAPDCIDEEWLRCVNIFYHEFSESSTRISTHDTLCEITTTPNTTSSTTAPTTTAATDCAICSVSPAQEGSDLCGACEGWETMYMDTEGQSSLVGEASNSVTTGVSDSESEGSVECRVNSVSSLGV